MLVCMLMLDYMKVFEGKDYSGCSAIVYILYLLFNFFFFVIVLTCYTACQLHGNLCQHDYM